jgi:hypothetical protein
MLTGLRTRIDPSPAVFLEIFLVTMIFGLMGKVGGTAIAAVLFGETWASELCLGTLAQTKGLMEVVVLAVLLEHDVLRLPRSRLDADGRHQHGARDAVDAPLAPRRKTEPETERGGEAIVTVPERGRS